ncbi:MAG: hypothetical protein ACOYEF_07725 [Planifilum sp.]|jgi:hypothetical protein
MAETPAGASGLVRFANADAGTSAESWVDAFSRRVIKSGNPNRYRRPFLFVVGRSPPHALKRIGSGRGASGLIRSAAAVCVKALEHTTPMFSPDGVMHPEGPPAVKEVLSLSLEEVRRAKKNKAAAGQAGL